MLHGDISNHRGYVIGFRCENTLFNTGSTRFKVLSDFLHSHNVGNKFSLSDIDREVYSLMKYIYWDTDMTVLLVVDNANYNVWAKGIFNDLPFNQVMNIRSISEITMALNTGELSYFVDNDKIERQLVNSRYAVDIDGMNKLIFRNRGR